MTMGLLHTWKIIWGQKNQGHLRCVLFIFRLFLSSCLALPEVKKKGEEKDKKNKHSQRRAPEKYFLYTVEAIAIATELLLAWFSIFRWGICHSCFTEERQGLSRFPGKIRQFLDLLIGGKCSQLQLIRLIFQYDNTIQYQFQSPYLLSLIHI